MCLWTMKRPAEECGKTLTREEVEELIEEIPEIPDGWIADDRERKEKFQQILAQGSREDLVRLITTIYRQKQRLTGRGRKLHSADEQIFRAAEKLLFEEFCTVLHLKKNQLIPFLFGGKSLTSAEIQ